MEIERAENIMIKIYHIDLQTNKELSVLSRGCTKICLLHSADFLKELDDQMLDVIIRGRQALAC